MTFNTLTKYLSSIFILHRTLTHAFIYKAIFRPTGNMGNMGNMGGKAELCDAPCVNVPIVHDTAQRPNGCLMKEHNGTLNK